MPGGDFLEPQIPDVKGSEIRGHSWLHLKLRPAWATWDLAIKTETETKQTSEQTMTRAIDMIILKIAIHEQVTVYLKHIGFVPLLMCLW